MAKHQIPHALIPHYSHTGINEPVLLHRGSIRIRHIDGIEEGNGTVSLEWLPKPEIAFHLEKPLASSAALDRFLRGETVSEYSIEALGASDADLQIEPGASGYSLSGRVTTYEQSTKKDISRLLFHLPNFINYHGTPVSGDSPGWWPGRVVLHSNDWIVTVDALPRLSNLITDLKQLRGYAITHTGEIRHKWGQKFTVEEARHTLEVLHYFLAFARGQWCSPVLPIGYDEEGAHVWESWHAWLIDPYRTPPSWLDPVNIASLSAIFQPFIDKWTNQTWRDPLRRAIYLYIGLNGYADVDVPIILGQSLFEMLAWTLLVEDRKAMGEKDFLDFNFRASAKLRKLLEELGIPCAIPTECSNLIMLGQRLKWRDAPHALTTIRNELIHPKERHQGIRSNFDARVEARLLTSWYAELCILALLGYTGPYGSRLKEGRWTGDVQLVPWVRPSSGSSPSLP